MTTQRLIRPGGGKQKWRQLWLVGVWLNKELTDLLTGNWWKFDWQGRWLNWTAPLWLVEIWLTRKVTVNSSVVIEVWLTRKVTELLCCDWWKFDWQGRWLNCSVVIGGSLIVIRKTTELLMKHHFSSVVLALPISVCYRKERKKKGTVERF